MDLVNISLRSNLTLMDYLGLAAVYDNSTNVGKILIAFRESPDARPPFEPVVAPSFDPVLARRTTGTVATENQCPITAASAAPS